MLALVILTTPGLPTSSHATSIDASLAPRPVRRTSWRELQARNYSFTFEEYLEEYGKAYMDDDEYADRKATFARVLGEIQEHNGKEGRLWKKGLNEHTDKSHEEWQTMRGYKRSAAMAPPNPMKADTTSLGIDMNNLPRRIDWREEGIVTPVKNQGACGSCWAFSAIESVESAVAKSTGKLITLSPQEYVDCVPNPNDCGGTGGCEGSVAALAFNWTVSHNLALSTAYPYHEKDGSCRSRGAGFAASITGWTHLPTNNYAALMHAVALSGPVSISLNDAMWSHYEEGIFDGDESGACEEKDGVVISHVTQLVGYGEEHGEQYWLVRNSWGTTWGEDGYIRMKRFGDGREPCGDDRDPAAGSGCKGGPSKIRVCGLCGILSDSSYPTGGLLRE